MEVEKKRHEILLWEIGVHFYRNGVTSIYFQRGRKQESWWHNSCQRLSSRPREFVKHSIFFSLDFRWDETHPPCEKEFTLLDLLTQTLLSSRNTLSDAPKLMFSNIHGEPVIKSSWLIKRLCQWLTVVGGHLFISSCPDQEIITQIIICNTVWPTV